MMETAPSFLGFFLGDTGDLIFFVSQRLVNFSRKSMTGVNRPPTRTSGRGASIGIANVFDPRAVFVFVATAAVAVCDVSAVFAAVVDDVVAAAAVVVVTDVVVVVAVVG